MFKIWLDFNRMSWSYMAGNRIEFFTGYWKAWTSYKREVEKAMRYDYMVEQPSPDLPRSVRRRILKDRVKKSRKDIKQTRKELSDG